MVDSVNKNINRIEPTLTTWHVYLGAFVHSHFSKSKQYGIIIFNNQAQNILFQAWMIPENTKHRRFCAFQFMDCGIYRNLWIVNNFVLCAASTPNAVESWALGGKSWMKRFAHHGRLLSDGKVELSSLPTALANGNRWLIILILSSHGHEGANGIVETSLTKKYIHDLTYMSVCVYVYEIWMFFFFFQTWREFLSLIGPLLNREHLDWFRTPPPIEPYPPDLAVAIILRGLPGSGKTTIVDSLLVNTLLHQMVCREVFPHSLKKNKNPWQCILKTQFCFEII